MALHNYIEKTLHDDLTFAKFDCKLNFAPDDFLVVLLHTQKTIDIRGFFEWILYMMELQIV